LLDEMTGELTSGDNAVRRKAWSGFHGGDGVTGSKEVSYGDTGGASRFYPQFQDDAELHAWIERLILP
jgi:hypothetical protein